MNFGNICLAILVFSLIIIIHEFGHFIVAKFNKVRVLEFSLGMGPRLISWGRTEKGMKVHLFKSGNYFEEHPEYNVNTLYSVKILPFGGSCMMLGEEEHMEDKDAFSQKSVYARMAIIFAGPLFNFILAFLLALILIGWRGYDAPVVTMVQDGFPMAQAGVEVGDTIREINGETIVLSRELTYETNVFHPFNGDPVEMVVERDGVEKALTMTPVLTKQSDGSQRYQLGFRHGVREKAGFFGTLKYSAYEVKFWISTTIRSLGQMISGKVSTKDISGPVGIVKVVGDVVSENSASQKGDKAGDALARVVISLINISILLTANLGVMNLLPIPALDGGRLLFLIIEWIRRKPMNEKVENYINAAGFFLLMALMVFILGNDIWKLF